MSDVTEQELYPLSTILRQVIRDALRDVFLLFVDGTLLTNPRFFKKIYEGKAFSASHRFENVASDSYVEMYFENPSNSGRTVYIIAVEITSFAQAWADLYRNNTVLSNGTEIEPVNLNFSSNNSSVVKVEYGGSYSLGNRVHSTVVPGGNLVRAVGEVVEVGESVIIPPDNNLIVKATNKSASASDIAIRIIWWEE